MKKFSKYLEELFDTKPHDFKSETMGERTHVYTFKHKEKNFHVEINHSKDGKGAGVSFHHKNRFDKTNDHPRDAHKVLSSVHHILKHHLEKHKEIEHVHFSAYTDEPSRVRLYHHLVKKHGGTRKDHEYAGDGEAEFHVKVKR